MTSGFKYSIKYLYCKTVCASTNIYYRYLCICIIYHFSNLAHLECHLRREYQLVAFEQSSRSVHEDKVGDTVDQVVHPQRHAVCRYGFFNGIVKHYAESLQFSTRDINIM